MKMVIISLFFLSTTAFAHVQNPPPLHVHPVRQAMLESVFYKKWNEVDEDGTIETKSEEICTREFAIDVFEGTKLFSWPLERGDYCSTKVTDKNGAVRTLEMWPLGVITHEINFNKQMKKFEALAHLGSGETSVIISSSAEVPAVDLPELVLTLSSDELSFAQDTKIMVRARFKDFNKDMATICHIPPGNPANAYTLSVPDSQVDLHIKQHADFFGPCFADAPLHGFVGPRCDP